MTQPVTDSLIPILLGERGPTLRRQSEPVTVGVPLPRGAARSSQHWRLESSEGSPTRTQVRALDRWSDGSWRWALLDFQADTRTPGRYLLHLDGTGTGAATEPGIVTRIEGGHLSVDTGPVQVVLGRGERFLVSATHRGAPIFDSTRTGLRVVDGSGRPCRVAWTDPVVEEAGDLRCVVRIDGTAKDTVRLDFTARLHFFAGHSVVRVLLTVRNPRRAEHPGGFWELGDSGSILLRELAFVVASAAPFDHIGLAAEAQRAPEDGANRVAIYQDSSGGDNWRSTNHVNRDGIVPLRVRGYRAEIDGRELNGLRANPVVSLSRAEITLSAAFPHFWQNFPRSIVATPQELTLGLFPVEFGDLHELQGGEQKTHEFYVALGADPVTLTPLEWCRDRLVAHTTPEWYAQAQAVPYLTPAASDPHADYLRLVAAAIEGPDTFLAKRERVDEYGWRHFGEIYGDHEAVFPRTPVDGPLVSHYNNQYDPIAGFAYQFLRSGDVRWWSHAAELAAHVIDIDIYHTDEDKSAYNHGLFWHTVHYVDAGRSTHRTYPRAPGSSGGGPASEHNYTTGLMLRYLMTGDLAAKEAAVGLAQFVIDMDDGSKTIFRWLDRGPTGLASASRTSTYHGPGRGSGNSLNALLDGHRLTEDRKFIDKAEEIIRRCVHPRQDLDALNLLDAENRWFYTMFLQSLAKYLDHKIELGQLDEMYTYGRRVLLHYARWMADHEYPYLEKPEILEYPTETWPAQDMRKGEIFDYASRHAEDRAEADPFREKARYFFAYATNTLANMSTRTLARPVVLLLSFGWRRAWFERHAMESAPAGIQGGDCEVGRPFVPQKARAMVRARLLLAAAAVVAMAAVLVVVFSLLR